MGHPRKSSKKYDTPPHPWNAERIKEENKLMSKYGLKNKKEIWKADTLVRKYSREARYLLGFSEDQIVHEKNELLGHLYRLGILPEGAPLEDILNLTVEDVLKRRLQSIVFQKGFSRTPKEARVFVVHGHIALDGKKIDSPSYFVKKSQEDAIGFYPNSTVSKQIEEYNKIKALKKPEDEEKSKKPRGRGGRGRRNDRRDNRGGSNRRSGRKFDNKKSNDNKSTDNKSNTNKPDAKKSG
jgi:small subunit ribosomal protein S4